MRVGVCMCACSEGKLYISAEVLQMPNEEESLVCLFLIVTAAHTHTHTHTEDKAASSCSSGTTVQNGLTHTHADTPCASYYTNSHYDSIISLPGLCEAFWETSCVKMGWINASLCG